MIRRKRGVGILAEAVASFRTGIHKFFIPGAGTGSLGLAIEGPSEAKMTCKDNRDGSCSVEYTPTESGEYDVSIQFAEKHIPGSPFKVRSCSSV